MKSESGAYASDLFVMIENVAPVSTGFWCAALRGLYGKG